MKNLTSILGDLNDRQQNRGTRFARSIRPFPTRASKRARKKLKVERSLDFYFIASSKWIRFRFEVKTNNPVGTICRSNLAILWYHEAGLIFSWRAQERDKMVDNVIYGVDKLIREWRSWLDPLLRDFEMPVFYIISLMLVVNKLNFMKYVKEMVSTFYE